ncbi:MAG: glycosyltransferase family 39 protein [Bacteroidales bacterium]|nr:glycosyltransferase family 39 protein [Bacteroidales bacterium]
MKSKILKQWNNNPIKLILWLAIIIRIIAAIFSKGFGMHDDHFLIIEPAQSWVDGYDNSWLPGTTRDDLPTGHSFFYVGIHYLILLFLKTIGLMNPQSKMFFIRVLHGALSLIVVYFGYKITLKLSDKNTAGITGLLLAIYWFMPFLSVRNLVEVACIPFLVYGTWVIIDHWSTKNVFKPFILAGFVVGLAFSVRFQTAIFAGGIGLALLLRLKWKEALIYGLGFLVSVLLIQGVTDYFVWGSPFTEVGEYVRYNLENATTYITGSWYQYILLILGILIPPVSFFLFYGFLRSWKKHLVLFLPVFIFLVFHSFFPNKQERFILPIIPFIIILGMIGWQDFLNKTSFFNTRKKLLKSFWIFFWIINLILLFPVSTMYSKKARVEAMTYLSRYDHVTAILIEDSNKGNVKMSPRYYLRQWVMEYAVYNDRPEEKLEKISSLDPQKQPRFILFYDEKNIEKRLKQVKQFYPDIIYETTITPGFIDKVLHWLNPVNANQSIIIYRNNGVD